MDHVPPLFDSLDRSNRRTCGSNSGKSLESQEVTDARVTVCQETGPGRDRGEQMILLAGKGWSCTHLFNINRPAPVLFAAQARGDVKYATTQTVRRPRLAPRGPLRPPDISVFYILVCDERVPASESNLPLRSVYALRFTDVGHGSHRRGRWLGCTQA